jgi:TIR domain/PDZ domain
MAHDVFISYSSKDRLVADAMCAILEREGVRCWIAPRDLDPGIAWSAGILDAIESSRVLTVIISGNANLSAQVKREVERAVAKGVLVIPFRIDDVPMSKELEYFLSSQHWLDAMTPPLEQHLTKLGKLIARLLSETPVAEAAVTARPPTKPDVSSPPALLRWKPGSRARVLVAVGMLALLLLLSVTGLRHLWGVSNEPGIKPPEVATSEVATSEVATSEVAKPPNAGLEVVYLVPASPASRAGFLPGDVIFALDRQPVANQSDWVRAFVPGDHVVTYWDVKNGVVRDVKLAKPDSGKVGFEIRVWTP